jgi:mannose-6-phosphate isomerase class I
MRVAGRGRLPRRETEALFRWVEVAPGDVVFVPAGTIHTIGKGIVLLEVQQTSDLTYRIHDWGRAGDRALHLDEARAVKAARSVPCPYRQLDRAPVGRLTALVNSRYFRIEAWRWGRGRGARGAPARLRASTRGRRGAEFHILAAIAGEARLRPAARGDWEECVLRRGACVLLPAALGSYVLEPAGGGATVLRVRGG